MSMLDTAVAALLDQLRGLPRLETLPVAQARAIAAQLSAAAPPGPALHQVADRMAGSVPIRVYTPSASPRGTLLWCHGGGWTLGGIDSGDAALRGFALRTGLTIISVDYRLAPEHPFPAAIEEAWEALSWVAGAHGGDGPLLVGGDSAGGNLAAALALLAREAGAPGIAGQLLFYPVTDADFDTPSYHENAEGYFLTRAMMRWFWENYVPDRGDRDDFRAAPLRASSLSGLPPTLVQTAEFDPLRDEGEAYAARLADAGNNVICRRYDGLIHGHFGMGAVPAAAAAIADAAKWVDDLLA